MSATEAAWIAAFVVVSLTALISAATWFFLRLYKEAIQKASEDFLELHGRFQEQNDELSSYYVDLRCKLIKIQEALKGLEAIKALKWDMPLKYKGTKIVFDKPEEKEKPDHGETAGR